MHHWINRIWYEGSGWYRTLLPLSALYWLMLAMRRILYDAGIFGRRRAAVPVIIVGNITVGGTGKTPVVIWLSRELESRGFKPGIVSRGYGGQRSGMSMRVDPASDPDEVGDEPVLLARHSGRPVVVDLDRHRAAAMLIADGANVILADDGLQHYRLERTYEICVIDGMRGLGNRHLLPAGPLRETVARLDEVDQVLINGKQASDQVQLSVSEQNAIPFELVATEAIRLDGSLTRPITAFSGKTVHALAGIGNPHRFFDMLRALDIEVIEHAYSDHARFDTYALDFGDELDVLMTEKDAVKIRDRSKPRLWAVPVELEIDPVLAGAWLEQVETRLQLEQGPE